MISVLITIAVLVLGPGLAYGQSPAWLLRAASKSMRASVCATEAGWLQSRLAELHVPVLTEASATGSPVTSGAETRVRSHGQTSGGAARSPGHWRPRWGQSSNRLPVSQLANPPLRLAVSRESSLGWSAGGAGLHPSVLKAVQPWLRGGYLDGSGRGDPADNKDGTRFRSFHLPHSRESDLFISTFIEHRAVQSQPHGLNKEDLNVQP